MAGNIDIGGYFDKLTNKGRGGRRLDGTTTAPEADAETTEPSRAPSGSGGSGGGLGDLLKDVLGRGRSTAQKTAEKVKTTAQRRTTTTSSRADLPREGVVTIEYSPQEDGDPDPGEVVWTWVPFEEDPEQGKDRPVVIVGRRGSKLVGIPLTTKANANEAQLDLGTGGWDPKRRPSYARIWRMLDVDPDKTRREGSVLDVKRFELLVKAVDEYYDIRVPAPSRSAGGSSSKQSSDYDY